MEISAQGGECACDFRRLQQLCVGALGQIYRAVIQSVRTPEAALGIEPTNMPAL
jgi:hypothetical protein